MPLPTPSDLHVDGLLTNISVAFIQSSTNFVAGRVFSPVPVQKQSDIFPVYDRGDFLRDEMEIRAPGSESAGGGFRVDTSNRYFADVWAFHQDVDDQTVANADAPFRPMRDATEFVSGKRLLKQEIEWQTAFFSTGVWDNEQTGGTNFTQWNDVASTPLEDVEDQIRTVGQNTGFEPNVMVVGRQVWQHLKNHPDIVDRIKYTSDRPVDTAIVARLLGLDDLLVSRSVQNTADEGATDSFNYILGRDALLAYRPPSPGLYVPAAGYTFTWNGLTGSQAGQRISRFRMEERKSDRIEIEAAWDQKVISSALGSFFNSAVST